MKHILTIDALNERTMNQMHILYYPSNLNLQMDRLPYRGQWDDDTSSLFVTYVTPQDAIRKMVEEDMEYVYVLTGEGRIITQGDFERGLKTMGYNPHIVIPDIIKKGRNSDYYKKEDIRYDLLWSEKGFEYDDAVYIFDLQHIAKIFNKMETSQIDRIRTRLNI